MSDDALATRFGELGDEYETYRVGYADAVYDLLEERWGVRAGAEVADVGCGTGLATRALAERGVQVTGVEPDAGMRARAQRLLGDAAAVVDGRGERLPFADASLDAVTAAQAAHWFTEPAASREIQRVLRPGGAAVYFWKGADPAEPYLALAEEQLCRIAQVEGVAGDGAPIVWPPLLGDGWTGYRRDVFEQPVPYTVDGYVGLQASRWTFTRAAGEHREAVLEAIRDALSRLLPEGRFVERNLVYVFGARKAYGGRRPRLQVPVGDRGEGVDGDELETLEPVGLAVGGDQADHHRRGREQRDLQRREHDRHLVTHERPAKTATAVTPKATCRAELNEMPMAKSKSPRQAIRMAAACSATFPISGTRIRPMNVGPIPVLSIVGQIEFTQHLRQRPGGQRREGQDDRGLAGRPARALLVLAADPVLRLLQRLDEVGGVQDQHHHRGPVGDRLHVVRRGLRELGEQRRHAERDHRDGEHGGVRPARRRSNVTRPCRRPPNSSDEPRISSMLPSTEPAIEARATLTSPSFSARITMTSSGRFPKVALSRAAIWVPAASPAWVVASPST